MPAAPKPSAPEDVSQPTESTQQISTSMPYQVIAYPLPEMGYQRNIVFLQLQ